MKLTLLAVVVSTVLTTPIFAAPNPEPLEIALSIDTADQVAPEQARIPLTASVTLHGATPEAVYPTVVQVNGKSFPIGTKSQLVKHEQLFPSFCSALIFPDICKDLFFSTRLSFSFPFRLFFRERTPCSQR